MSRWAPDARERLEGAALQLFAENGYDNTTVAQIAERAGLNRATFFRHFADKREILFGGEDRFAAVFADSVRGAPTDASVAEALRAALAAAEGVLTAEQRPKVMLRRSIAAASAEVQERGLLKRAAIAWSTAAALRERGTDDLTARLGAELLLLAFSLALERWVAGPAEVLFGPVAVAALDELQERAAGLDNH